MPKILFVCKGNNCRSQIAEAIYNRLTNSSNARSAGTHVDGDSETLAQFSQRPEVSSYTLDVMRDAGYDLEDNQQNQLTQDMIKNYDVIISMAAKRYTPQWLANAPNYVYWKITDPKGRSYAVTKHAKDEVEQKVRELIAKQRA
jgi:protein-tyrosine-phosphatase